ncbi:DUF554 domain-containing protein [Bacillus velezensis]|uniref:DUF554 domain-containing protein n=1 Tax=Bacillus TaxID=1386 RepID=UPI00066FD5BB|nr:MULTISPECIES: DUF554 domain-containing protein [Bacillus]AOU02971.1 DUF554 domain-containing protein [Bacillus velezensis]NHN22220.1 DUF554 domain-containing protein [Bacillus amyloliquefaciens]NRG15242.1 DUF554 domain-containing protein [Bacillus velezensis]NRR86088.1 DUF554 domain-containing protein [Bacillus velezensis]NRS10949.1 DUF554 domain-containing protein [Bacillus velezensis]
MIGTIFNTFMIFAGCLLGGLFKKGMKGEYQDILMQAMGFVAVGLGINAITQHLSDSKYPILFIVSLAVGGLLGQFVNLELRFNHLVSKFSKNNLAEGLSTAILLFCMGSLSILGPIESAIHDDSTYLLTNGMLDGITSIVLASAFGFGIALSAVVLFAWQGSLYLFAKVMESALSADMINEITIVGGILILSSGLSILGIKKCKTLNLLPSLIIPPVVIFVMKAFGLGA